MDIAEHLHINSLHHAHLIEGARDTIVPELLSFFENNNIKTSGNPDFYHAIIDNFKIEEAFDLRSMSNDKSFSTGKKIYLICANSLSIDAQNVLLKMFEEPVYDTHFFLVVPDINSLQKTLVSRFYLIKSNAGIKNELTQAEKFSRMHLRDRIEFIKDLLAEPDEEDDEASKAAPADSVRSNALVFLNALESVLHKKILSKTPGIADVSIFAQFFQVRKFLRQPGSSTKMLMESVALIVPTLI